jgi:hypothetical protein
MTNWLPDINRWKIPAPPQWFLTQLWDLDCGLVILPSRRRRLYILARRRELSLRAPLLVKKHNELLRQSQGSDGDMLATYNLQHVDVIKGTIGGSWSPAIFADLRARDTWTIGAEKYADKLDETDKATAAAEKAVWIDDIDQRAKDSWRSLQARTGQRNHHARNSGQRVKKSPHQPSSSTAGSGIVITG